MNEIENCRKFYRILKNRDSSKFRVQRLVRTKLIYRLLGRDKYSWELLETGDRDVQYDFSSLNKAQEAIDYCINYGLRELDKMYNDSQWDIIK